jgi:hypothetical protein
MVSSRMGRQAGGQVYVIDTGLQPVMTQKSTTALFVPLTGPLDTTNIKEARGAMQLAGITGQFRARAAYRMSDDGITWSATVTNLTSYATANGWAYNESTVTSFTTDQKLFVQFGVEVSNVSGAQVEHGMAQLRFQVRNLRGQSLVATRQKVWSSGGASAAIFHGLTRPILIEDVGEYRATLELMSNSGDVQTQPAYQVSNDGRTWYSGAVSDSAGSFTTFGTNRTTNGITYGSTFTSFAPAEMKKWVRFGVATKYGSSGVPETGMVTLRVDVRRT